jgi:hypothetical protein
MIGEESQESLGGASILSIQVQSKRKSIKVQYMIENERIKYCSMSISIVFGYLVLETSR